MSQQTVDTRFSNVHFPVDTTFPMATQKHTNDGSPSLFTPPPSPIYDAYLPVPPPSLQVRKSVSTGSSATAVSESASVSSGSKGKGISRRKGKVNGCDNGRVPPKKGFMEKMHPMNWGVGMGLSGLKAFRPIRPRPATSPRRHEKASANCAHTVQSAQYPAPREEISLLLMQNHFLHALHNLQNQSQPRPEGLPQNQVHVSRQPLAPGPTTISAPNSEEPLPSVSSKPTAQPNLGPANNSPILSWDELCAYVENTMSKDIPDLGFSLTGVGQQTAPLPETDLSPQLQFGLTEAEMGWLEKELDNALGGNERHTSRGPGSGTNPLPPTVGSSVNIPHLFPMTLVPLPLAQATPSIVRRPERFESVPATIPPRTYLARSMFMRAEHERLQREAEELDELRRAHEVEKLKRKRREQEIERAEKRRRVLSVYKEGPRRRGMVARRQGGTRPSTVNNGRSVNVSKFLSKKRMLAEYMHIPDFRTNGPLAEQRA